MPEVNRNLAGSAENLTQRSLQVAICLENTPYLVHFCHLKILPSLVQAFKTVPFVVLKVTKTGPYLS